jgi:2-dehydro-3-deoxyphosphogluconate aldolase/(4S)-4-hydroxy-2-oxoglutarate aldolase
MRNNVISAILREKIIAIVRGVDRARLIPLADALYSGGVRLIETTYSPDGSVSDEATAGYIKMLSERFAGRMYIGAGTVLTARQVNMTKDAGGTFIISPNANEEIIRETRRAEMVSIPGALTPTEITAAHDAGADFVKLFPVSSLGPEYVKAIKAPLSHIKLLAVGGIDENNMAAYLKAGVSGFGVGSNIVKKSMIEAEDYAGITRLAQKYVSAIEEN